MVYLGYWQVCTYWGREKEIHIFAPPELEQILKIQYELTYVKLSFKIIFHHLTSTSKTLILEDENMEVYAFPLKHRIPCYGFLFKEKIKERAIISEMIKPYELTIPEMVQLKKGNDIYRDGEVVSHKILTSDPPKPKSYAFCTDTKYYEKISEWINDVDILYHESTFLDKEKARAKATFHTTALQAGQIAKISNVGQLLLGHFSARYKTTDQIAEEAQTIFPNTICVNDGDEFLL